ncbi:hypothetical protein KC332_g8077 [Hortaea werneckii]|nr:hypothetical protein KC358_g9298 [Hortaea werneckii]KAI6831659.1 hypothetical protein KC350_g7314 [Hortaea werneckii]KAI6838845.1 hypothetical protein KC342_g3831 [Hortaea werneckii]KAI6923172.1 hypothetical protein KC348_g9591 [Hortaea werneckii]KAI6932515.1 hypothetical protein KC341_g8920 [Hortaea werneckii]
MQFLKVFSWVASVLEVCVTAIALPQEMHPMTVADDGSPTPSNNIARAGRNKARIIPTPVPNILSTAAHSTAQPPAKTMDRAYSTSCFAVTFPTSTTLFASRSPIDVRYTRRELFPSSVNVAEREPQTASILVWCISGTEEGKILSESRNTGTELAKPAHGTRTFARPIVGEASLV